MRQMATQLSPTRQFTKIAHIPHLRNWGVYETSPCPASERGHKISPSQRARVTTRYLPPLRSGGGPGWGHYQLNVIPQGLYLRANAAGNEQKALTLGSPGQSSIKAFSCKRSAAGSKRKDLTTLHRQPLKSASVLTGIGCVATRILMHWIPACAGMTNFSCNSNNATTLWQVHND
jgi:hypothetical protein